MFFFFDKLDLPIFVKLDGNSNCWSFQFNFNIFTQNSLIFFIIIVILFDVFI